MKVYENLQTVVGNKQIRCPNCGALNPAEALNCEECEATLIGQASMWVNIWDTLFSPVRAMCRIAATLPVMQAFLIVLAISAVSSLQSIYYLLVQFSFIADNAAIRTPAFNTELAKLRVPDSYLPQVLTTIIFSILTWFMFSAAAYLFARLFYRNLPDFKNNFWSMLAVVGFTRLTELLSFLYTLIGFFFQDLFGTAAKITPLKLPGETPEAAVPAFTQVINDVIWRIIAEGFVSIGQLVWKLVLIAIGVHYTTGLNWNRSLLVAVIPALLFIFLLRLPF